jgi:hypothetical protein
MANIYDCFYDFFRHESFDFCVADCSFDYEYGSIAARHELIGIEEVHAINPDFELYLSSVEEFDSDGLIRVEVLREHEGHRCRVLCTVSVEDVVEHTDYYTVRGYYTAERA